MDTKVLGHLKLVVQTTDGQGYFFINPPMAKGGVWIPPPTGFFNFSQKWEELFLQTKFLPVGSSLGHLLMKKFFRSYLPSWP